MYDRNKIINHYIQMKEVKCKIDSKEVDYITSVRDVF